MAETESTVLIRGESGVGKELIARAVHRRSGRSRQPFVVVDCAALYENLLQSELFGHEKGAYTGAIRLKHGLFEVADRGTMFLDEIGELTPPLQVKLLRVLETGVFRRVGGTADIRVDVRVIAATNRARADDERAGFREDLYYRLNVFSLQIAPLRERREDVPILVEHFIRNSSVTQKRNVRVAEEAMGVLGRYPWPGNVREHENVIERARAVNEVSTRTWSHYAGEAVYRFFGNQLYVAGRYNVAKGRLQGIAPEVTVNRIQAGGGWFLTRNMMAKAEYVLQEYKDFPATDIRSQAKFEGAVIDTVVSF